MQGNENVSTFDVDLASPCPSESLVGSLRAAVSALLFLGSMEPNVFKLKQLDCKICGNQAKSRLRKEDFARLTSWSFSGVGEHSFLVGPKYNEQKKGFLNVSIDDRKISRNSIQGWLQAVLAIVRGFGIFVSSSAVVGSLVKCTNVRERFQFEDRCSDTYFPNV